VSGTGDATGPPGAPGDERGTEGFGRLPRSARVFVTGASGFIGSHLVRRLVSNGVEVHALTSTVSSIYPLRLVGVRERIALHEASLVDRGAIQAVVEEIRPSHVFHLGAYTHVGKSWLRMDECVQVNVQGTVNLLEALERTGYRRFVNIGTSEIYGDIPSPFREDAIVHPVSPYAASKHAAETFCQMFQRSRGSPIVMLRPFNAYGPAQTADRVIPEIILRALRHDALRMTEGHQTREFNYVEDVVDGIVRAGAVGGIEGELLNIGCEEDISIRDLALLILDRLGNAIEPRFGALQGRPAEIWTMRSDSSRARELLGWKPRHTLADGLERTIEWFRSELSNDSSPFIVR
jgi:nucleoside-diphosphate-sugar epimerase